ncbi:MAG: hypothetical protein HFE76_05140 [Firmicutes bacterium]|nr:hypothetical protein [Bacillota bacterium]
MAPCNSDIALGRIEKIKKNQVVSPGSSPYNQAPEQSGAPDGTTVAPVLPSEDITDVMSPDGGNDTGGQLLTPETQPQSGMTPELIPDTPTFTVPANPLLPPGYQEILDYNAVQYVNGFYRTQIGRYVRIEQLMGSNTLDTQEGFLIGVGINYILLQEAPTGNVQVIDIYGIKTMYIYYNYRPNPFEPFNVASPSSGGTEDAPGVTNQSGAAANSISGQGLPNRRILQANK